MRAALQRRQLRIAELGSGSIGSGELFDCCGVVVLVGPKHEAGSRRGALRARGPNCGSAGLMRESSFVHEESALEDSLRAGLWDRQRQWVFIADMSTAETAEPGVLLAVEIVGGKAAVDFMQETTGFEGEHSGWLIQSAGVRLAEYTSLSFVLLCSCYTD